MNMFKDQAEKVRITETIIAGFFVCAMILGFVLVTLDMIDKAAVRGSVRICESK